MLVLKKKGYFGRVLKGLRIRKGLLLRDIAGCLGKSIPYISDVEKGHRNPLSFELILTVSLALNLPEDILIKAAVVEQGVISIPIDLISHKEIDNYILKIISTIKTDGTN